MPVICLHFDVGEPDEIYTFLFDIVEIPNTSVITYKRETNKNY